MVNDHIEQIFLLTITHNHKFGVQLWFGSFVHNFASEIIFSNDELHIILTRRSEEICEHSSFSIMKENVFLNRPWNSRIKKNHTITCTN